MNGELEKQRELLQKKKLQSRAGGVTMKADGELALIPRGIFPRDSSRSHCSNFGGPRTSLHTRSTLVRCVEQSEEERGTQ